jgi:hypothetical protein
MTFQEREIFGVVVVGCDAQCRLGVSRRQGRIANDAARYPDDRHRALQNCMGTPVHHEAILTSAP